VGGHPLSEVRRGAPRRDRPEDSLAELEREIIECRRCPRLVAWREQVAREKVARYRDEPYWGRPLPGFGDPDARILIVGLAPAAHGGNRTGRVFTGDASGDFLWAALHRAGIANKASSRRANDGLSLTGARIAAAVRCAPPLNKPTIVERDTCAPYLARELEILDSTPVLLVLGAFAWTAVLRILDRAGEPVPRPRPRFGHGVEVAIGDRVLIGSFHPSQQNTFTKRLTPAMLDAVIARATALASPS